MELLNPDQLDAITEVANIGMSRAATQLSTLLQDRIDLDLPGVQLLPVEALPEVLETGAEEEISCVWQRLDGVLRGNALLLLNPGESRVLVNALMGDTSAMAEAERQVFEREALTEIGNIIISSAAASMADMLGDAIPLTVAEFAEEPLGEMISGRMMSAQGTDARVLLMHTRLRAAQRNVSGTMVVLLGIDSLSDLAKHLDALLQPVAV